ncbi:MAG: T9SS type A sorting domain-containing protein [Chitinispirillaceae bacterium]|nr:T9SS type A sorting domain-containing protein [Chitinispirillaceae bacterium]
MGKHIIRLSRWSTRSLYQVYSRLLTLVFALFCGVTGQIQRSASSKQANNTTATFKGTAYLASDSSVLKNIQFYLENCILVRYGIMPDYGIMPEYGVSAWYGINTGTPLATFKTDENGNFQTQFSAPVNRTYTISSEDIVTPGGKVRYYTSGCLTIKAGVDTSYTLYFQNMTTSATPARTDTEHQFTLSAIAGKDFLFQIPDWKGQNISAAIINSQGQKVTTLNSDATGKLCWNTRAIAGGIYFLQVQNDRNTLSMKILVK